MRKRSDVANGTLLGLGAYIFWGLTPLYFVTLKPVSPWEIVSWRVLFALIFCFLLIVLTKRLNVLKNLFTSGRTFWLLLLASIAIFFNRTTFLFGTTLDVVVEIALGLFLNPILISLLGVFVMKDKLRPMQWISVGITAPAVTYLILSYGAFPWVGIGITVTFSTYALIKRAVGPRIGAIESMTLETILMTPIALCFLLYIAMTTGLEFGSHGAWNATGIALIGIATAVPLIMFGASSRLIPLATSAMLQFILPVLAFIGGVFVLNEDMPFERWVGFLCVAAASMLVIIDSIRNSRKGRRQSEKLFLVEQI